MAFIKHELMHQKILDAEADINEFLRENELDESYMIQAFELEKEVFQDESEAIEYIESRGYFAEDIDVTETRYLFNVREIGQFNAALVSIPVRRGVTILVGQLAPVQVFGDEEIRFRVDGVKEWSIKPIDIKNFNSKSPLVIEVAKVVKGFHPKYGEVEITENDLQNMERNFKEKITGVDLSINKDHEKVEALGWFKDVFLSFDGKTLLAEVSWCPEGVSVLRAKSFRYFSPEFSFNYTHPHTGEKSGATLTGGALTNYPFLKMDAITELNIKGNGVITMDTISLTEHKATMLDFNTKITALETSAATSKEVMDGMKATNVELNAKVEALETEKALVAKTAKHERLFNDGKISKAQFDLLEEGKDLFDVLELNGKLHTEGKGVDTTNVDGAVELNADDKAWCLNNDMDEADFIKYNKGK